MKIEIQGKLIVLFNIYGPNTDNTDFFNTLDIHIQKYNDHSLILGGDFNTVINYKLDKLNGRSDTNKKCNEKIKEIIENNDLCDKWRLKNPHKKVYTWHSNTRPPIFCRLDYFLISQDIVNCLADCNISTGFKSDHSIISIKLNLHVYCRGPGYFKINNSYLLEQEYQSCIRASISEIANINREANPNTLWEIIKGSIRDETIKYASKINRKKKEQEETLKSKITELEQQLIINSNDLDKCKQLIDSKSELNNLIENNIKGILLRAKAQWIEGSEKNTKYFANLEKKRAEAKSIQQLKTKNNSIIQDQKDILNHTANFYKDLYKKDTNIEKNNYERFFTNICNKISPEQTQNEQKYLSQHECAKALLDMKNNKSPGSDGISAEFYKIFWTDIKEYVVNSLNYSLDTNNLTELQKQSIITLLPKTGKDTLLIDNWRPVSLLNVDYKIATKAIANRIKPFLNHIISTNQTGFIKGRYIGENVRLLQEIIERIDESNETGLIFFSDFNKAFDSLDHEFMFKCLRHFGFSEHTLQWVKLFYKDATSRVTNNGHFSEFFCIKRGVRQGCPLSPYLFIICIELMSIDIELNTEVKGIKINNVELKQSLFADDASFILDGSRTSFETLIKIIEEFAEISGLTLNRQKCKILKIGAFKNNPIEFCKHKQFIWNSKHASTLGIEFSNEPTEIMLLNFPEKIHAFETCLNKWKRW